MSATTPNTVGPGWQLSRPCWQCCANRSNNSQQCWDLPCIVGRIRPLKLYRSCVMRVRGPQQCWRSCAINGSNIVALRLGDHGTKEMLRVVGSEVGPVSNFAQQHATTCNRVCKRTQHVTSNNFESCWSTTLRPFGSARCSMRL